MIEHYDAIRIERIVIAALNCDRGAMAGLVSADHFEKRPLDAALMLLAAKMGELSEERTELFANDWFSGDQLVTKETVEEFCSDLRALLD